MDTTPLPDRWHSRDLLFLIEVARALDAHTEPDPQAVLGLSEADADSAWHALREAGYLRQLERPRRVGDGRNQHIALTERGRRVVGLWPSSADTVDAFEQALRQAEAATDDPEEKGAIRRALGAVTSVSREVMIDVIGAVVAKQSGMG